MTTDQTLDPRLLAQLGESRHRQATVFSHDDCLGGPHLLRDFRYNRFLVFQIQTQGPTPFLPTCAGSTLRQGLHSALRLRPTPVPAVSLHNLR